MIHAIKHRLVYPEALPYRVFIFRAIDHMSVLHGKNTRMANSGKLSWLTIHTYPLDSTDLPPSYLLEAKFLVGDLEEDLNSIHRCHDRLGHHAGQPSCDDSLQSDDDIITVVLHMYSIPGDETVVQQSGEKHERTNDLGTGAVDFVGAPNRAFQRRAGEVLQ